MRAAPGPRAGLGPHATRVVVVASVTLVVAVVAVLLAGSRDGTYELRASFDDVRGLLEGGDVRAGAVKVGVVRSIRIAEDERPEVTMDVDDDFRLHRGARADVRLASNVGAVNRAVELLQGDPSAPLLPDGARLAVGATDQPVNFDEAVETLDPPTRRRLGRLVEGLERTLHGRGPDVDRLLRRSAPALNETAELLHQVGRDGVALRTLVRDGERVTGVLARDREELGAAADALAGLLRTTAGRQAQLRESVARLAPALTRGRAALDAVTAATPQLRRLARGLGPVATELRPLARLLPRAMQAAGPLTAQTRRLVERGPAQLRELRPIIRSASPVARKLTPVAREALPLARVLQVYVPETVGAFQNFGAISGAYDANGHILNVASGLSNMPPPSTVGRVIGPADCDRDNPGGVVAGLLQRPYIRVPGVNECQPWKDLPPGILPEGGG